MWTFNSLQGESVNWYSEEEYKNIENKLKAIQERVSQKLFYCDSCELKYDCPGTDCDLGDGYELAKEINTMIGDINERN